MAGMAEEDGGVMVVVALSRCDEYCSNHKKMRALGFVWIHMSCFVWHICSNILLILSFYFCLMSRELIYYCFLICFCLSVEEKLLLDIKKT